MPKLATSVAFAAGAPAGSDAGCARAGDGRELLFSIMTNATGRPAPEVRAAMDHIDTEAANAAPRRREEP